LLAEASAEANSGSDRMRQLFAVRYYLHDLLLKVSDEWLKHTSGVTNYAELLDQIQRLAGGQQVCLVTFNYDLLLDRALLSFNYKQTDPENEPLLAHPTFRLFKPHGSVDWARFVDVAPRTRLGIEQIIEQANTVKLTNTYVRANATHSPSIHSFERPIAPAIAVPVQTKTENFFEWPQSHRAALEQHLPSVTKILIIGWQAKEAHFLKLLKERLPTGGLTQITHLQVIGRDTAEAMNISKQFTADISRNVKKVDYGPTQGGFSHFVAQGLVDFLFK
jgi:SIR2-like domain